MYRTKPQTAERLKAVETLYSSNYGRLRDDALASNPHLTEDDAYTVVDGLAGKLQYYPDRFTLTEDVFCGWAANVLELAIFAAALRSECEGHVLGSIRRFLSGCKDLGVTFGITEHEIASDVWLWALTHIDELMKPGAAALTTRMYEQAEWYAMAWRQSQIRARERFATMDMRLIGVDLNGTRFIAERDSKEPIVKPMMPGPIRLGPGDTHAHEAPEYHSPLKSWETPVEDVAA